MSDRMLPQPLTIGESAVRRFNLQGLRENYPPLNIIDTARIAMSRMPDGKAGIVLGSGPNTMEWKQKGWRTLDVDPNAGADYTMDANRLEEVVHPGSQDFVLAERILFDYSGKKGLSHGRLLREANFVLKPGGTLIIRSTHVEGSPTAQVPDRHWYAKQLRKHGFQAITEVHDIHEVDPTKGYRQQEVFYYGVKLAEGFSET